MEPHSNWTYLDCKLLLGRGKKILFFQIDPCCLSLLCCLHGDKSARCYITMGGTKSARPVCTWRLGGKVENVCRLVESEMWLGGGKRRFVVYDVKYACDPARPIRALSRASRLTACTASSPPRMRKPNPVFSLSKCTSTSSYSGPNA